MTRRFLTSNAFLRASVSAIALMSVASCAMYPRLQAPLQMSHNGTSHAAPPAATDTNNGLPPNMDLLAPAPSQTVAAAAPSTPAATSADIANLIPDTQVEAVLP